MLDRELLEELRECRICPRNCGVNRLSGEKGFCEAGKEIKIARAALHQWEEPCISGERGSGTVFFTHCNLKCVFCQNHEISQGGCGLEITIERLADIFFELQEKGAHNINLVTPTHYIPQIVEALKRAKNKGLSLPIVYNSSGYDSVRGLELLEGLVDIYLPDVKFMKGEMANVVAHCQDYFPRAMEALAEMFRQTGEPRFDSEGLMVKGIIVRHLLLPGQLETAKRIIEEVFNTYENHIFYSLMNQYTPIEDNLAKLKTKWGEESATSWDLFSELGRKVTIEEYEEWLDFAENLGLENGFIQEGDTADESFIPLFDFEGVVFKSNGLDK